MKLEHLVRQPFGEPKKTPLVLLHGAHHGAWCYEPWLAAFSAQGYETHALSLPAHGNSEKTKHINLYSLVEYRAALAEIVESISPTPFVIGHSMGGFILQHYLQEKTLPGAVLLASAPVVGMVPFLIRLFLRHPLRLTYTTLRLNTRILINSPERFTETFFTSDKLDIGTKYFPLANDESFRAVLELMLPIMKGNKVKTPMLVVCGDRDQFFTVREEKRTAEAYKADFILCPGQTHDLMLDTEAAQTAAKIGEWLEARAKNRG